MLPARLSQHSVGTVERSIERIEPLVRMYSIKLTTACRQAGLSVELAELCGGLLASVIDDLIAIGRLERNNFERTMRKQRILATAEEPAASALRIAIAASPINGRAAVAHWDVIADRYERGQFAFMLGMPTEPARLYSQRHQK